jgi:hypothetical protein
MRHNRIGLRIDRGFYDHFVPGIGEERTPPVADLHRFDECGQVQKKLVGEPGIQTMLFPLKDGFIFEEEGRTCDKLNSA